MENQTSLNYWQETYNVNKNAYQDNISNMDDNELAYSGKRKIKTPEGQDAKKQGSVSRKMCFELIETQVDITIPAPRVVSLKGREDRARMIESVLKNETDRLNFEEICDEQARLTPTLGGSVLLLEWDNTYKDQFGVGRLSVRNVHPKQVIPQDGVYKLEDMDYFFIEFEQTEDYIKAQYGVDVSEESDENTTDGPKEHMRTHIYCYYKNDDGTIGLFSWVGNTVIQDYDNYFARLQKVCGKCGKPVPTGEEKCECGSKKFKNGVKEYETINVETVKVDPITGQRIPVTEEIQVKYYVPKIYPIVIRKNVANLNKFLGGSDIDAIKDQQNDLNIYMTKIREKLLKGGSWVTYPDNMKIDASDEELKMIPVKNAAQKALFEVTNVQPNTNNDVAMLNLNYEIGRQTIGITDSFQGRADYTATSGKAKEIQAQQAAGRLESKRVMKEFAFSQTYEKMFKFLLAFMDDQMPFVEEKVDGSLEYKYFDKKMFIDRDEDGNYYYDDGFAFSTDVSSTLSNNRQLMWRETRSNFESGAYGDPTQIDTLIMYWTTMNKLHYPGAPDALKLLQQRQEQMNIIQQQQMRDQAAADAFAKYKTAELLKENIDLQNNNNKLVGTAGSANSNRNRTNSLLSKLGIGGKKNVQD